MTTYDIVPFFYIILLLLCPMPITAHKKRRFRLDSMKRLKIFFQDWAFGHRVAFKRLLRPFISAGLHKRGVRSLGDVQWAACSLVVTLHPSCAQFPLSGRALVLRTTVPLHSSFFGKVQLRVVVAGQERERERG
jgi:hypothetical protein